MVPTCIPPSQLLTRSNEPFCEVPPRRCTTRAAQQQLHFRMPHNAETARLGTPSPLPRAHCLDTQCAPTPSHPAKLYAAGTPQFLGYVIKPRSIRCTVFPSRADRGLATHSVRSTVPSWLHLSIADDQSEQSSTISLLAP
jgi:hypothetical protein